MPITFVSAKESLKNLTGHPGVYQFFDFEQKLLYIGKAKNLKKRVSSYFSSQTQNTKTQALAAKIHSLQVIVTHSETEALLLEQTLIQKLRPPYNILLRDDKSYPFIYLSSHQAYPRLKFHRGAKPEKGELFGPYPSGLAVHQSLQILQKVFKVRQCEDSFFSNRSRPCLNYQIKRCSGPCVGLISPEDYAETVEQSRLFLTGKSSELISQLAEKMEHAAHTQNYEIAAHYRDQIIALRRIQESQHVSNQNTESTDVIGLFMESGRSCIHLLMIRDGRVLGGRNYLPNTHHTIDAAEILNQFISQYYLSNHLREIPHTIILPQSIEDAHLLNKILTARSQHKVHINIHVRGNKAAWLRMATTNAKLHLTAHLAAQDNIQQRFIALQETLQLAELPERLECFDISHTQGEFTYASCVVFDHNGPIKSQYRRYRIKDITPGDDYAAIEQALLRRYSQTTDEEALWPNIIFIDGGKGQLHSAQKAFNELPIEPVLLIAVSKGPHRKAGLEKLWRSDREKAIQLPELSPALHLIQSIRDEAHRFAITGNRQQRNKQKRQSSLETISGIGPKRRRQLLTHFGGLQELKRASAEDLAKVTGISAKMAKMIYAALHEK